MCSSKAKLWITTTSIGDLLGRNAEAVLAFDKTIELASEKFKPEIRMARALALAHAGDYKSAMTAVETETSAKAAGGIAWFDGAKVLVACAQSAATIRLSTGRRAQHCQRNPTRRLLARYAVPPTWATSKINGRWINSKGSAFSSLEQRADFKQLVSDVYSQAEK